MKTRVETYDGSYTKTTSFVDLPDNLEKFSNKIISRYKDDDRLDKIVETSNENVWSLAVHLYNPDISVHTIHKYTWILEADPLPF